MRAGKNWLPVARPTAVKQRHLAPRIRQISRSRRFSNRGPQVVELENRIGDWVNVNPSRVVALSNATIGLAAAAAVSPSKTWNLPAWSFPATALAPLQLGRSIRWVDLDPETWLPTEGPEPPEVGLISVIPFGARFDEGVWRRPGEHIIDAAASLATRPVLEHIPETVSVVFSLHATKTLGGSEGGLVVFGSEEKAREARQWINFGISSDRTSLLRGTNGKMSEYDAAVANARLDGWPQEHKKWAIRRQWAVEASRVLGISDYPDKMNDIGPYWIGLFESREAREVVRNALNRAHVDTRLWWAEGLQRMKAFAGLSERPTPIVESLVDRYLGLPFFPSMRHKDFKFVEDTIREVLH